MLLAAIIAFAGSSLALSAAWYHQWRTGNAWLVDPLWAATLGSVAIFAALVGDGHPVSRSFVGVAGGVWGWRLAAHLWQRNHGKPEDARYRELRDEWGPAAARKLFWFLQLQAVIGMVLCVAFFVPAFTSQAPAPLAVVLATLIWLAANVGEATADRQLRHFAADEANRGTVCRAGWWRYSRHPNYFFECVHWCAYTALAIALPWGWTTLIPPLLMAWLLLKVSGIPMLEAHLLRSRPGYAAYQRSTSALVPWPPKALPEDPSR